MPWSARSMPDMNDPHFITLDFVVDFVRIADERQLMDAGLIRGRCHQRKIGEPGNPPLDHRFHGFCGRGRSFAEIWVDFIEIGTGTKRVAYPHHPGFLKKSAISVSEANSPFRACARPSRIAARVSSSSRTGSARLAASENSISAASSCSDSGNAWTFLIASSNNF